MNVGVADRPLDHTTARVVSELASTLLPRLEEVLVSELKKAAETLPDRTNRGVEETMIALDRLIKASDEIAVSLNTAEESARNVLNSVLPAFSNIRDQLDAFAARSASAIGAAEAKGFLALQEAIANWEGVLKADGRAQTRELSEFSSELSELTRGMEATLPQAVKDAVEKAMTIHRGEWEKSILEQKETLEKRLARIEKIAKILAIGWGVTFACVLTNLALYL
ncbi:MAG: hypothetical protein LBJ36_12280 [Synergistaceae bacterium]|jgi:hypothetical protein|nr:hypothetical protein [Synergistaceae bacterium]